MNLLILRDINHNARSVNELCARIYRRFSQASTPGGDLRRLRNLLRHLLQPAITRCRWARQVDVDHDLKAPPLSCNSVDHGLGAEWIHVRVRHLQNPRSESDEPDHSRSERLMRVGAGQSRTARLDQPEAA